MAQSSANSYRRAIDALLTASERRQFVNLDTPQKIQAFLDKLPANFERGGATHMSPRRVLQTRLAHCTEGALLAAACLLYHRQPAFLMDLRSLPHDHDHVVTLFKERGLWGAISKTNHATLRWRDPIYRTPRELAMSFAHEYYLENGHKTLLAYSRPFRLTRYRPKQWVTERDNLDWLFAALDDAPHLPVAPKRALRRRRLASKSERRALLVVDWPYPKRKKRKARRG